MKKKHILLAAVLVILAGFLALGVWLYSQKNLQLPFVQQQNAAINGPVLGERNGRARFTGTRIDGTILSLNDTTVVIDSSSSGQKALVVSPQTRVSLSKKSTKDELIQQNNNISAELDSNGNALSVRKLDIQRTQTSPSGTPPQSGQFFSRGGNQNAAFGEIFQINGNTVTLKQPDNTTKDITLTDTTEYTETVQAKIEDLKTGLKVNGIYADNNTLLNITIMQ